MPRETTHHVVIRFFLLLLFLLFLHRCIGSSWGSATTSNGSTNCGPTASSPDIAKEILHVLSLESFCKKGGPDGLKLTARRIS